MDTLQNAQEELLPPLSSILRHVGLWNDYFLRWSPAPSFMPLPVPIRGMHAGQQCRPVLVFLLFDPARKCVYARGGTADGATIRDRGNKNQNCAWLLSKLQSTSLSLLLKLF